MKKCLLVILFLLCLCGSVCAFSQDEYKVIKVIDGDTFYIDFNRNNFLDADEKVRVNGIDTFENKKNPALQWQMQNYNLTFDEALGLGYFAQKYAKKELLNKYVRVEYTANTKFDANNRHLMSIYYDCKSADISSCKSYEQEVLKEGLAKIYTKSNIADKLQTFVNNERFGKYVSKTRKIDLVVRNKNTGKIHKTTCDYAWASGDVELIKKPLALTNTASCCFQQRKRKQPNYTYRKVNFKNDINLYFVNPTKYEYPQNNCKSDNCKALLSLIRSSKTSIDFALYGFDKQDDILIALKQAQQRGVSIRGIVDKDEAQLYHDTNKLFKIFINVKRDKEFSIARKEQNGKFTRATKALMHNKFFIIDKQLVWTGSTNVSASCMTFNANNAVVINSAQVANLYTQEFEQMFELERFHTSKKLLSNNEHIKLNNGTTDISIYFSPKTEALTNYVRPLIRGASKSIHISMFYLTHKRIVEDLIEAKKRGVDVKIILDGGFVADGYSPHVKLRDAQIPLKIENWRGKMHMKNAIIDDNITILGSTNWTATAELVNDENMLIVVDKKVAQIAEKNFQKMWKLIPDEWLYRTPEYRNNLPK